MANVNCKCSTCGNLVKVTVSQHVDRTYLLWNGSYRCSHCGADVTFDDDGFPPEDVRKEILAEGGSWELLVESSIDTLKIALCINDALGQPRKSAIQLRKMLPGPISQGTKAEMHWLRNVLAKAGYESKVVMSSKIPNVQ